MEKGVPTTSANRRPSASAAASAGDRQPCRVSNSAAVGGAPSEGTAGSVGYVNPGCAHVIVGIAGGQRTSDSDEVGAPSKRVRKERGPNWSADEVKALIEAKREIHEHERNTTNSRELMIPDAGKWQRISALVMRAGASPCLRDGIACKSKWNQLIPDYKKIADYAKRSGNVDASFWHLSFAKRREEGLPRSYPHDIFSRIHEWYGAKPDMLPSHGRDLLEPDDSSFRSARSVEGVDLLDGDDNDVEIAGPSAAATVDSYGFDASTQSASTFPPSSKGNPLDCDNLSTPCGSPCPSQRPSVPAEVVVLSSSETASPAHTDRPSNTGVKRKSVSGHTLIAEATKLASNALSTQMKDATDVSRDIEKSKMDMQIQQFDQQMAYQRDKERRLLENARTRDENEKMSIGKQTDVVHALLAMTDVFRAAFLPRSERNPVRGNGDDQGHAANASKNDLIPVASVPGRSSPGKADPIMNQSSTNEESEVKR